MLEFYTKIGPVTGTESRNGFVHNQQDYQQSCGMQTGYLWSKEGWLSGQR